jgi:Zn-dependent protease
MPANPTSLPGSLTLGRFRGAPIQLHWSAVLGMLFFSGGAFAPGRFLGFLLLVLVHELGHAVLVRRHRLRVLAITLHGLGGECRHEAAHTELAEAEIAWGGVLAQLLPLGLGLLAQQLELLPATRFTAELLSTLVRGNLVMMVLNLIPMPPLDGHRAWRYFALRRRARALRSSRRRRQAERRTSELARRLAALDDQEPDEALRRQVDGLFASARRRHAAVFPFPSRKVH